MIHELIALYTQWVGRFCPQCGSAKPKFKMACEECQNGV